MEMVDERRDGPRIAVEVACATPRRQRLIALRVAPGTTAIEAVWASGVLRAFPEIDPEDPDLGIFGRPVDRDAPLADGDRVEIYRPLRVEPREARRLRAAGKPTS